MLSPLPSWQCSDIPWMDLFSSAEAGGEGGLCWLLKGDSAGAQALLLGNATNTSQPSRVWPAQKWGSGCDSWFWHLWDQLRKGDGPWQSQPITVRSCAHIQIPGSSLEPAVFLQLTPISQICYCRKQNFLFPFLLFFFLFLFTELAIYGLGSTEPIVRISSLVNPHKGLFSES